jgi:hypothetical protein
MAKARARREDAAALFAEAMKADPRAVAAPEAYLEGLEPRWGGGPGEAQEFVARFKQDFPTSPARPVLEANLLVERAEPHFQAKRYGEAAVLFQQAFDLDPQRSRTLYRRAYEYSRNHRITTLFVHCLKENAAMMHIARKAGMEIVLDAAEVEAHLHVPPGDPLSYTEEFLDNRVGLFDLALKSQFLAARTFTAAMANAAETLAHPLQQEEGRQSEEDKKAA